MAGPAIRCWEFAKALAKHDQVTLISPNQPSILSTDFRVLSRVQADALNVYKNADILIAQTLSFSLALKAKWYGLKIIVDAYDPIPLEYLEQFSKENLTTQTKWQSLSINQLTFNFQMADGIICASEKQRDLWIGFLLSLKLISPKHYHEDKSLRNLIDVVPFGMSDMPPKRNGIGLKEKYGFSSEDKIILWGGGIWNWFDPLSLIQAMKKLKDSRPEIKLVFMGLKNPEPSVPEMEMSYKAIELSKELNLWNQNVFFNSGWVPYDERQNNFLDASIGLSTHFDHLETRYSFRTRMLDYIWTELPILATEGDSFAELIDHKHLGKIVSYQDSEAIADAILALIDQKKETKSIKENLSRLKNNFYWTSVIKPIQRMSAYYLTQPKKSMNLNTIWKTFVFILNKIKDKGFIFAVKMLKRAS